MTHASHKNVLEVLQILKTDLPACFKKGTQKIPLVKGIHEQIISYYNNDKKFYSHIIYLAVGYYVTSTKYLKTLVSGTPRIDINGNFSGAVTTEEENHARRLLNARKKSRDGKT